MRATGKVEFISRRLSVAVARLDIAAAEVRDAALEPMSDNIGLPGRAWSASGHCDWRD